MAPIAPASIIFPMIGTTLFVAVSIDVAFDIFGFLESGRIVSIDSLRFFDEAHVLLEADMTMHWNKKDSICATHNTTLKSVTNR
jgi:hypothetical protein